jgi:putative membrane protein
MRLKLSLPATVTGLMVSAAMVASPAAAQQAASLESDSIFIQTASSVGLLQVKLGKLAEKKASSPAVVDFGKRMVSDYSKVNEEFATAAKQAAFPAPVLLREHQQLLDRFNRMGRSSFEKQYMAEMVKQHRDEVTLFQRESEGGRVQSLKQLASKMLPDLHARLTLATETAGSIGAQVTASAAEPGRGTNGR